jgi:hypothetical protein
MSEISEAIDRLRRYDEHYIVYSDRLSSACRQLAFAEGAVFWAFKEPNSLSLWVAIGFFILVCYFVTDTLQYYFGMRDYERLGENARNMLHRNGANYSEINNKDANQRLECFLKYKLIFISIASLWMVIVFVKTFFIYR